MATYIELFDLAYSASHPAANTFTPLTKKVAVATSVAAIAILSESSGTTNHAARLIWANNALKYVLEFAQQLLWSVLQDSEIIGAGDSATDSAVQTAVNGLVNRFAV